MPQSWNRYSYVLGNPMTLVDPTGMYWAPGTPMPILPGDPNGCTMCILKPDSTESPEWQRQAIADYRAIAAMGGRLGQLVQGLIDSKRVHVIKARGDRSSNGTVPDNEADAMNGNGSGSSIYYNPLSAWMCPASCGLSSGVAFHRA